MGEDPPVHNRDASVPFASALFGAGVVGGGMSERNHYRSIRARESADLKRPVITKKTIPSDREIEWSHLALGSVVISVDYWKRLLMGLRRIFGGEITAYSSLIDRGRREAMLRMRESSPDAELFVNYRIETATISSGQRKTVGSVEVVAYSTAIKFR